MDKSDFKVIYNYVKNLEDNEIHNVISNIESTPLKDTVEKIGKEKVLKTINKISDFIFAELNTSIDSEISVNSNNTSELLEEQNINTDALTETSIEEEQTSVFLEDQNINTELLSETSQIENYGNKSASQNGLEESNLFLKKDELPIDNGVDSLNDLIVDNINVEQVDNNLDSIIDAI